MRRMLVDDPRHELITQQSTKSRKNDSIDHSIDHSAHKQNTTKKSMLLKNWRDKKRRNKKQRTHKKSMKKRDHKKLTKKHLKSYIGDFKLRGGRTRKK